MILQERPLTRQEIAKYQWRTDRVKNSIKEGKPFKTKSGDYVVVTLQIIDNLTKKVVSENSSLVTQEEENAFDNWVKGSQKFSIKPVWNNVVMSWTMLTKDSSIFRKENTDLALLIKQGSLTPTALGLSERKYFLRAGIMPVVKDFKGVENNELIDVLTDILVSAVESTGYETNSFNTRTLEFVKNLTDTDKRTILKEFGEIVSAIVMCKHFSYESYEFSNKQNTPLVDFSLFRRKSGHEERKSFSVKSMKGSASSIRSFFPFLKDLESVTHVSQSEKKAKEQLLASKNMSLHDSVIFLAQQMRDDQVIDSILKNIASILNLSDNFTSDDIKQSNNVTEDTIKQFYDTDVGVKMKTNVSNINLTPAVAKSLFLYPVLKSVVNYMNRQDSPYKSVMIKSINRGNNVSQVRIDYDDFKSPTKFVCRPVHFDELSENNIMFSTKAMTTSFASGGIGMHILHDLMSDASTEDTLIGQIA